LSEDERVERIAVVAVGARDEPVIGRIVDAAVEHAIEPEQPGLLVQLVLVHAPLRDLHDHRKRGRDRRVVEMCVVPGVHPVSLWNASAGVAHGASVCTSLNPIQTATRPHAVCSATFQNASVCSPPWPSVKVSSMKLENVVKPPRMPTKTKVRSSGDMV